MKTNKAGSILLDLENKKICLVYREKLNDYSFPKGHIEGNETLLECALRETEEETCYKCRILDDRKIGTIKYSTPKEDVEVTMFVTAKIHKLDFPLNEEEVEEAVWKNIDEVEESLSYDNLKEFWISIKDEIINYFNA